ncbi:MAG: hypothetical protein QOD92_2545 [Acidimicrobiaceae bacterium]|jgi:glycosyltransferase involved in cell wall biosynthesis
MVTEGRRRVVVATGDIVRPQMAGPAIRAWNLAAELSKEHDVRLVSTAGSDLSDERFAIGKVDDAGLRDAMAWCDVFVAQGWVLAGRRFLTATDKVVVCDLYDPMHLEQLEQGHEAGDESGRWAAVMDATTAMNEQLMRGDLFLCASSKQRAFYLGQLSGMGRINPATYDADESLDQLLITVPFGIDDSPPARTAPGVKGVIPGIEDGDVLVLWGGGIYNWFDPLTLIQAIDRVRVVIPKVRLLFMGLRHPNPEIPEMRMAVAARALSDELGLTDTHVFFNEGWVPFNERHNLLLDADVGVSSHLHHVETEFAYRTRILDYFWADVPVVATNGDALSDLIEQRQLGLTVPPGDVDALARALERITTDTAFSAQCRANISALAPELRWSSVAAPLVEFCRAPRRAPDLADPRLAWRLGPRTRLVPRSGWRRDAHVGMTYLHEGGVGLLVKRLVTRTLRSLGVRRGS